MVFQNFQEKGSLYVLGTMLVALVMLWIAVADAQTPDLDLVTERSLGLSVSAANPAAYRSGLLVAPWAFINGGAFVYGTQSVVDGVSVAETLQWRVQGGPRWRKISLQFYVDSQNGERLDYAWFIRPGEWRLASFLFSGGFGTLLRQETRQTLGEAGAVGDRKVKGLAFVSGHYDKGDMDVNARLTFIPGILDNEHDLLFEPQVAWDFGRFSLTGLGRFGRSLGDWDKTYTAMVTVPF